MADVELRLTADLDQATKEVAGFRKEYADLVKQVEKPLRQVNATRDLEKSLESTSQQLGQTKQRLKDLQAELIRTDYPSTQLKESFKETAKELQRLERIEATQANQLSRMRAELKGAGVDTTRLAQEQRRLNSELTSVMGAGRQDSAARGIRERAAALKQQAVAQRQANIEAARNKFGITQMRGAKAELVSLRQQFELIRTSGSLSTRELAAAQRQLKLRIAETKAELKGLNGGFSGDLSGLTGSGKGGGRAAAAAVVASAAGVAAAKAAQGADEVARLDARLKLATRSQQEFNIAQSELDRIADATQGDVAGLVDLYGRLQRPLRDVGFGQQEALDTVEAVTLSLKISGATAAESDGAVRQFAQALSSGTLRGDEFNSVIEQSDRLAGALADELGVTIGQLREMAKSGELTASTIVNALGNQLPTLRKEFSAFAPEITAALERAGTEVKRYWGRAAKDSGISDFIATMVNDYAKGVNRFNDVLDGSRSAEKTAQIQKDIFEKEEVDRNIRRLADEEKAAAKIAGVKYEEQTSLRSWAQAMGETYDSFIAREQERHRLREAGELGSKDRLKAIRQDAIADKKAEIVAQEALLKDANAKLEKAKKKELAIEQEFKQLIAELRAGGATSGSSFADATSARAGARQALVAGDYEKAISEARRAGEILKNLQAAGENDYGFSGIAQDLARIATEAARLERVNTEKEVDGVKAQLETLKAQAEALKVVSIDVQWDQANAEQIKAQMQALAAELAKVMIIKPTVLPPGAPVGTVEASPSPDLPGAATGGILRGPGTGTSDSILARLSNGEGVLNARAVQHYGAGLVHMINRLQLPQFATGGVYNTRLMPDIPAISPALLAAAARDLGTLNFNLPDGESFAVQVAGDNWDELRKASLKYGRTTRR